MISFWGEYMNKTGLATNSKQKYVLRIPPDLYAEIWEKVIERKTKKPGYSINEYLTDLINKDLRGKKK